MEDRSAGGWVRRAASVPASTRPCASPIGISSVGRVVTPSSTRASASSTEISAISALRAPRTRRAAGFFQKSDALDPHATLDRLHHVVDGETRDRYGGERLHLDAGL